MAIELNALREKARLLELVFDDECAKVNCDKWTWYRACAAATGHVGQKNNDTSRDIELSENEIIKSAHYSYIKALHAFYKARDGEGGVLGGLNG